MALQLKEIKEASIVKADTHQGWHAWIDLQPPGPPKIHVVGDVLVPNPGVEAYLLYRWPQGFNPYILLLELVLFQRPGIWPQVLSLSEVHFKKVVGLYKYKTVQIFTEGGGGPIAEVPVEEVH
ncbi:MAG: hypothetical protein FJX45_11350 [Alphaproteobacteria bacterium]|nr:hypothetical protein [Alphaproteobacteria bacterium]MBM3652269.1 hypothetical protein [Alphaproteobacteria bacterium]